MNSDIFTFLVGGKAGEGVKKAGEVAARLFSRMGRQVFLMEDYQSLIKGGHNFSVISSDVKPITSHYLKANLLVLFDKRSYDTHADHWSERGIAVYNSDSVRDVNGIGVPLLTEAKKYPKPNLRIGVSAVVILSAALGLDKDELRALIKSEYPRDTENNVRYAMSVYDIVFPQIGSRFKLAKGEKERRILTGNEAIALGAAAGGLDIYVAYPMTPSSSILHFLAKHGKALGVVAIQPENEIAVINMTIGSTFAGARTMLASSGGGFALMEEAFSLAGMAEAPILCVLSSRPGPSTGLPTYTAQTDLKFAIHQGHGEFPRIVASPGSIAEAFHLSAQMLNMVWRFQTPGILLTEKHLSESGMTVDLDVEQVKWPGPVMHREGTYKRYLNTPDGISPFLFPPSKELIKWSSDEHDESGIVSENANTVTMMYDKRLRKHASLVEYVKCMHTVNTHGNSGPRILTYGSTTMSVLEALKIGQIEATVIQPVFLEPLPIWELQKYRDQPVIVVEQSSTGQFASLLREKIGIQAKAIIKQYNGRPFEPIDLAEKIKGAIHG